MGNVAKVLLFLAGIKVGHFAVEKRLGQSVTVHFDVQYLLKINKIRVVGISRG